MIRWSIQRGFVCIPKSCNEGRIAENANIFDFEISEEDMQELVGAEVALELSLNSIYLYCCSESVCVFFL